MNQARLAQYIADAINNIKIEAPDELELELVKVIKKLDQVLKEQEKLHLYIVESANEHEEFRLAQEAVQERLEKALEAINLKLDKM